MAEKKPNATFDNVGRNVQIGRDGDFVVIRMAVSESALASATDSKTGKTRIVAGTGGFVGVPGHDDLRLSLNLTTSK